ncbi:MAG: glycosyltransferase [Candidatus Omnitrophica bacterium]|nr:glycosyltransferase [Candidatus Omnitrophota bacterium]
MQYKVAVIIPAKGVANVLRRCVASVVENAYPDKEIIIVDDGIEPEVLKSVKDSFVVKILDNKSRGPSFARNFAANSTDAQLLAFTDSDCIVDKHWIEELVRGFNEFPGVVSCGGIQKIPEDACEFEKKVFFFMQKTGFISEYMRSVKRNSIIFTNHNASCNAMYKRDVFLNEGGFKVNLWPGEDVELDYRLSRKGYSIILNPAAIVYHYRPKNLKAFALMMYRYGVVQGFLVRQYGLFRLMHVLPLVTLCVLLLAILAIPLKLFLFLPALLVAGYIALLITFNFDYATVNIAFSALINWHAGFVKGFLKYAACRKP